MSVRKLLKLEDSTKLSLPAAVYTEREYLNGSKPFGTLYMDKKGQWHLVVNGIADYTVETKGTIIVD
jgi:hypothetical protein